MRKKPKRREAAKVKTTVSFSADAAFRLDVLVAEESRRRGRRVDRSELIEELLGPHLKAVVVSVRGGPVAPVDPAA
jgi:hypothetical protein